MSWAVDFTTRARADLVGLDQHTSEAVTDALVAWMENGPPMTGRRELAGFAFFEETVADRYLLGYSVKQDPPSFAVLWLRAKPGAQ